MKNEFVLGFTDIHSYTHDNSAVLLRNGKILFAASEERYTRIKHDPSFPKNALSGGLKFLKINSNKISKVAVGYPKRKTFSVLSDGYFYEVFPFLFNILKNRNVLLLIDLILVIQMVLRRSGKNQNQSFLENKDVVYVDHHLAHAASAYYTSGLEKSIGVALDGFGPDLDGNIKSGGIFICDSGEMNKVMSFPIYASLGLFYQAVTYMLDFSPDDGEGKTMGLASYGNPEKAYSELKKYCPIFKEGVWIPPKDWLSGLLTSMPKLRHLFKSTDFGKTLNKLLRKYKREDLAAAAQKLLEEQLAGLITYLLKRYPEYKSFNLSGGVFLNVRANKKIRELKGVQEIFIHPHAGDGGVSLGAAFAVTSPNKLKKVLKNQLVSAGLGESFRDEQILKALRGYHSKILFQKRKDIVDYATDQLKKQGVIGWFQGRAEWGPRALGFRSVLADPRDPEIKTRINDVLKNREWFMPFAPSILEEKGTSFFQDFIPFPFMTLVFDVVQQKAKSISAAIHIDNTARANSVSKQNNLIYYKLLQSWYKKTSLPVLLNTSFNRHGLPIVNSPQDAVDHLIMGAVDELIIGNYSVQRR